MILRFYEQAAVDVRKIDVFNNAITGSRKSKLK